MLFEELDIKSEYDSRRNFVYADFFNKILPFCNHYRRFGGIFSGEKFVQCAEGLQEFIKENSGKMELSIIPVFDENDKLAFKEKTIEKVISEKWKLELSEIKDTLKQDHVKALAWMIVNDYLEIKLILPQDENGNPLTQVELKKLDILNEVGIFFNKDEPEDYLSFRGEIDVDDGEVVRITTSRPWIESEKDQINSDYNKFVTFWDDETCKIGNIECKIKPLTEELLEYFKQKAPETKQDIPELKKLPQLRDYQKIAVDNDHKGIFEMATGTGKTFTAIGCIKKLQENNSKLAVVISAPYTNLVDQWESALKEWYVPSVKLEEGWTKELRHSIRSLNETSDERLTVFICSHAKFATDDFIQELESCNVPVMLIVDEAHHVGAGISITDNDGVVAKYGSRAGLSEKYTFRLGLSATIERHFDSDGTDFLLSYFKGSQQKSQVCILDLKEAIEKKFLCGYNYYPSFVELTTDEFIDYKEKTIEAMKYLTSKVPKVKAKGDFIIMQRSKIVRDAENKMDAFVTIMKSFSKIKHLLVFCSEKQYDKLETILKNSPQTLECDRPVFRRITYDNPKNKRDRIKILRDFANEDYDLILSNRVLDEGMDVPQAKNCIILASTGNPAQFIQRRGRVLRQFDDLYIDGSKKTHADIFDVLVKPKINGLDDLEAKKLEINLIRNQYKKIKEMSELAMNKDQCLKKINEFTCDLPKELLEFDEHGNLGNSYKSLSGND